MARGALVRVVLRRARGDRLGGLAYAAIAASGRRRSAPNPRSEARKPPRGPSRFVARSSDRRLPTSCGSVALLRLAKASPEPTARSCSLARSRRCDDTLFRRAFPASRSRAPPDRDGARGGPRLLRRRLPATANAVHARRLRRRRRTCSRARLPPAPLRPLPLRRPRARRVQRRADRGRQGRRAAPNMASVDLRPREVTSALALAERLPVARRRPRGRRRDALRGAEAAAAPRRGARAPGRERGGRRGGRRLGRLRGRDGRARRRTARTGSAGPARRCAAASARSPADAGAAVVLLADGPDLAPAAVDRVVAAWRAGARRRGRRLYGGVRGHPVVLGRAVWDDGARRGRAGARAGPGPCDDLGSPGDVDRPDDLPERLR